MRSDLHIHMLLDGMDYRAAIALHRPVPNEAAIRARLADYQRRGVTLLRDGGDAFGVCLRAKALAGEYGIDYRCPAFPIHRRGHYGAFIGRAYDSFDEYLRLLDEVGACGGDFVKLMISGLIDFSTSAGLTEEGLSADEIFRLIDAAHCAGFAVMVHANGDDAVCAAVEAGADSVEHGAFLSQKTLRKLTRTLWVPTLSTIGNLLGSGRYPDAPLRHLLRTQQEKVAFVAQNGGKIGLGSDAGAFRVAHGKAIAEEHAYLSACRVDDKALSAAEALVRQRFVSPV